MGLSDGKVAIARNCVKSAFNGKCPPPNTDPSDLPELRNIMLKFMLAVEIARDPDMRRVERSRIESLIHKFKHAVDFPYMSAREHILGSRLTRNAIGEVVSEPLHLPTPNSQPAYGAGGVVAVSRHAVPQRDQPNRKVFVSERQSTPEEQSVERTPNELAYIKEMGLCKICLGRFHRGRACGRSPARSVVGFLKLDAQTREKHRL